jgi:hypothetical protein
MRVETLREARMTALVNDKTLNEVREKGGYYAELV